MVIRATAASRPARGRSNKIARLPMVRRRCDGGPAPFGPPLLFRAQVGHSVTSYEFSKAETRNRCQLSETTTEPAADFGNCGRQPSRSGKHIQRKGGLYSTHPFGSRRRLIAKSILRRNRFIFTRRLSDIGLSCGLNGYHQLDQVGRIHPLPNPTVKWGSECLG